MGTNGLYVFKYNKRYYVYFKGNDSYPTAFGKTIINELQQMSAEDIIELKNLLIAIEIKTIYNNSYCGYTSLVHSLQNPKMYAFYITEDTPELYIGISYIYIINFDKNEFTVKFYGETRYQTLNFDMNNIPVYWDKLVEDYDG